MKLKLPSVPIAHSIKLTKQSTRKIIKLLRITCHAKASVLALQSHKLCNLMPKNVKEY